MKLPEIKGVNFKREMRRVAEYVSRDTDHTSEYYCRHLGFEVKDWAMFLKCQKKPTLQQALTIFKWFRKLKPPLLLNRKYFIVNSYWREYRFDMAEK
jgi:hypothetical protein